MEDREKITGASLLAPLIFHLKKIETFTKNENLKLYGRTNLLNFFVGYDESSPLITKEIKFLKRKNRQFKIV